MTNVYKTELDFSKFQKNDANPYSLEVDFAENDNTIELENKWKYNLKSLLSHIVSCNYKDSYTSILTNTKNINLDEKEQVEIKQESSHIDMLKIIGNESGELLKYVLEYGLKMKHDRKYSRYDNYLLEANYVWLYRQLTNYMCGKMPAYQAEVFKEIDILKKTSKFTKEEKQLYEEFFSSVNNENQTYKHTKYMVDNYYNHREKNNFDLSDYIQECLCILLEAKKSKIEFKNSEAMFEYAWPKLFENLYSNNLASCIHFSGTKYNIKTIMEFESLDNIKYDKNFIVSEKEAFADFNKLIIRDFIDEKMYILSPKEKYVLSKRYASDNSIETFVEIAKDMNLTPYGASLWEKKALYKLEKRLSKSFKEEDKAMLD